MTKASAGVDQMVTPAGDFISLLRLKSSDGGLRVSLLVVPGFDNIYCTIVGEKTKEW